MEIHYQESYQGDYCLSEVTSGRVRLSAKQKVSGFSPENFPRATLVVGTQVSEFRYPWRPLTVYSVDYGGRRIEGRQNLLGNKRIIRCRGNEPKEITIQSPYNVFGRKTSPAPLLFLDGQRQGYRIVQHPQDSPTQAGPLLAAAKSHEVRLLGSFERADRFDFELGRQLSSDELMNVVLSILVFNTLFAKYSDMLFSQVVLDSVFGKR